MNVRNRAVAAVLLPLLLLAGCGGGAGGPRMSDPLKREVELSRKAGEAFEKGRYDRAAALYEEALRISRSVEHIEGTAAALVSLAVVYREAGEHGRALAAAREILEAPHVDYPAADRAEAAYLTALVALDGDDLQEAEKRAGQALSLCGESRCAARGRIVNLQARVTLLRGDPGESLETATAALGENRRAEDLREAANSLRIMAESHLEMGRPERARPLYEEALSSDKKLGLEGKIAADLLGLGDVERMLDRHGEALRFYLRSLAVCRSAGLGGAEASALARIESVGGTVPGTP